MLIAGVLALALLPGLVHEARSARVDGGTARELRRGDVIVIPCNTPHWFKVVRGPVLCSVVKVRCDRGT